MAGERMKTVGRLESLEDSTWHVQTVSEARGRMSSVHRRRVKELSPRVGLYFMFMHYCVWLFRCMRKRIWTISGETSGVSTRQDAWASAPAGAAWTAAAGPVKVVARGNAGKVLRERFTPRLSSLPVSCLELLL